MPENAIFWSKQRMFWTILRQFIFGVEICPKRRKIVQFLLPASKQKADFHSENPLIFVGVALFVKTFPANQSPITNQPAM
jgi:hypothetical protein